MVTFKNYGHMKSNRLFAAVLAAIAFAGCVKENQPADQVNPDTDAPKGELVTLDFTASLDPDTKTTFGPMTEENTLPVVWEEKDVLAVFVGDKAYSDIAITIDEESAKKAHFTAQIDTPAEGDGMMVFYPSQGAAVAEGGIQFTLDAEQLAAGNGLPKRKGSYQPLAAAVADAGDAQAVVAAGGASLNFRNVFAAVRFTFPANDIMKISFKGNDNEDVAGTYVVAADGSIAGVSEGRKEVTLVTSDNKPFKAEYDGTALAYQLLVAPQTFEKGFTLTITTAEGVVYKKSTTKKLVLNRSDIVGLGEIKVTGMTSASRAWGMYDSAWYASGVNSPGNIRNIAMDDKYIYLVTWTGPRVDVVNVSDGSYVKSLDVTGVSGGYHTVDANVIDSKQGTKLLVCNMVMAANASLKLYAYDSIDSQAECVLDYKIPSGRYGDKFTVEGTWEDGKIYFYDFNGKKTLLQFDVKDGVVSQTPQVITLSTSAGTIGGFYKYSDTEYLWAGVQQTMYSYTISGSTATSNYHLFDTNRFSANVPGACFIAVGGKKYLCHVAVITNNGKMVISKLTGTTLAESLQALTYYKEFYLAGEDSTSQGESNGNAAGDAATRVINGTTYVAAFVTGSGLSLFEIK